MDAVKKPPFAKPLVFFIIPLLLVSLLIQVFLLFGFVRFAHRYKVASAAPLVLNARIIAIDEYRTEDSTSYDAIMCYSYQGVTYEAVYQSFSAERDANTLKGSHVTAIVDPEHPEDTVDGLKEKASNRILFSGVLQIVVIILFASPYRKRYVQAYGWRLETIGRDILLKYRSVLPIAAWICIVFAMAVIYPGVFFGDGRWLLHFFFPLVYLLLIAIGAFFFLRDYRYIRDKEIVLRRDTFVRKRIQRGGEDGDSYFVTFTSGIDTWEKSVSKKIYAAMKEGDTVDSAYLGNRKKPSLNFYHNEEVF